jgi:hypothetical protein
MDLKVTPEKLVIKVHQEIQVWMDLLDFKENKVTKDFEESKVNKVRMIQFFK